MAERARRITPLGAGLAAAAGLGLLLAAARMPPVFDLAAALVGLAFLASLAYLAWRVDPAWLFTAALLGSTFNSNWSMLGVPGSLPPDRLVLLAGIIGLLLRSPPAWDRPVFRFRGIHALLGLTLAWAVGSGIAAQTMGESTVQFYLLDRMAVPFAVFMLAPLAFRTARHRAGFLAAMVGFGAYLGLTAIFEIVGPHALVFPKFILYAGEQPERAQGPFLDVSPNGMALYACAIASVIALRTWRSRWKRNFAVAVLFVCVLGLLFTLTRSVWLGASIATVLTLLLIPGMRRFLLPALGGGVAVVLVTLALVPQFAGLFSERANTQDTIWERRNVDAAALNMVAHRPLLGFGLGTFNEQNATYFPLLADVPLFSWHQTSEIAVHNVFLLLAVELGLVGAVLFVASMVAVVGSAVLSRGPPELRPWKIGLFALAVYWVVAASFAPTGEVFSNLILWLWAGIVLGGAVPAGEPVTPGRPRGSGLGPSHELALRNPAVGDGGL
jgi:putative inorganic carbon (hco3(-)) transporter